uniref:Major latex-like protein n=1 Tax=Lagenaria siceraria TaxID=3668 RepID=A0A1V1FNB4_LAGSI|nr:major latex-like protein [Lagenaria siceraria]
MVQTDSIWVKVDLKSSPEKVYGFFRNHLGDLVGLFPETYQSIQLVEGQRLSSGSVVQFKFQLGDELRAEKWAIRVVDDAKKYIIYEAVEGDPLKEFKVLRAKFEVVNGGLSKVRRGNFTKWTVEFEKANQNVASPQNYLELFAKISKGVDAYFSRN